MTSQHQEPQAISSVSQHYDDFLAAHYDWMFGVPFEAKVAEQRKLFEDAGVTPVPFGCAIDLGCGSGFQSFALSELGYRVLAIDSSERLLRDLAEKVGSQEIETKVGDIRQLSSIASELSADIIVCMGDTLTHLSLREEVSTLFRSIERALKPSAIVVVTYRDLAATELVGVDRFIPVHSDDNRVMMCFIGYEGPGTVIVHGLVHVRSSDGKWSLHKSCYRKLRLSTEWLRDEMISASLSVNFQRTDRMVLFVASKNRHIRDSQESRKDPHT